MEKIKDKYPKEFEEVVIYLKDISETLFGKLTEDAEDWEVDDWGFSE